MGVSMTNREMKTAMKENIVMPDSVFASREWKRMPLATKGVMYCLLSDMAARDNDKLRVTVAACNGELTPLRLHRALKDLAERGLIVQTLSRPNRYKLNFPPYA